MNTQRKLSRWILILFSLGFLSACGNNSEAPPDGSILINPSSIKWDVVGDPNVCVSGTISHIHPVLITVKDGLGQPLGNIDIYVSLTWGGNNSWGDFLFLFDDFNGDGLITADELVNTVGDPHEYVTTTEPNGSKTFYLGMSTRCAYKGWLQVYSGSVFATAELEVTITEPTGP
ncbi:MAG: hypothetical protein OEZ10_05470 [Gammaproteobacteria bacterium]|nr:hypothetical protein [Gammaproteobacteria bacterium]